MTTIHELSQTLQTLLTTTADVLAKSTGFIRRQRQVTGAGFAQALVLGGLDQPTATRRQQQQHASRVGMSVSVQGLEQRFSPQAVKFLRQLLEAGLEQVVSGETEEVVLPQFNGVYLTDCTRLVWGQSGMKLAVRWEVQHGRLQARLEDLKAHDQKTSVIEETMPAGALHLADLGFFKLARFARWSQQGLYWLTRFKVGTRVYRRDGTPLDVLTVLTQAQSALFLPVLLGAKEQLPAYLVAAAVPQAAYDKRMVRLREQARLDQRPLSVRQSAFAPWTLYLTNIPDLTFAQAHVLARTRWQIELLFKLWKSQGQVLASRSADPIRQQCEGYAKLVGLLVAHWLLLVTGWQAVVLSATDALRLARCYAPLLMRVFAQPDLWALLFRCLCQDIGHLPRPSKRRNAPLAFHSLRDFDLVLP